MKSVRIPEVHYYEWSVSRWATSSTRDRLDATGRGIFRELLDLCYAQGKFPFDIPLLCRKCACTEGQFQAVWPVIEKHFSRDRHDPDSRVSDVANVVRKAVFQYADQQRRKRLGKGKSGGTTNPTESVGKQSVVKPKKTTDVARNNSGSTYKKNIQRIYKEEEEENKRAPDRRVDATPPPFEYERHFGELWNAYPKKGRTKIVDSQREYFAAVSPDPERIHAEIIAAVGGKWAQSEVWARGMVCSLLEFLRNQRWREDPEPFDAAKQRGSNGRSAALESSLKTLEEVDLSDVETRY